MLVNFFIQIYNFLEKSEDLIKFTISFAMLNVLCQYLLNNAYYIFERKKREGKTEDVETEKRKSSASRFP